MFSWMLGEFHTHQHATNAVINKQKKTNPLFTRNFLDIRCNAVPSRPFLSILAPNFLFFLSLSFILIFPTEPSRTTITPISLLSLSLSSTPSICALPPWLRRLRWNTTLTPPPPPLSSQTLRDPFPRRFSPKPFNSSTTNPSTMLSPGTTTDQRSSCGTLPSSPETCFLNILNTTISPASFASLTLT